MNITNSKVYWMIRNLLTNVRFHVNGFAYGIIGWKNTQKKYKSFEQGILRVIIPGIIKAAFMEAAVLIIDFLLEIIHGSNAVDVSLMNQIIISGIASGLVILGLYHSNISSIYAASYSNAPSALSDRFYNDRLTQKCIISIIDYIFLGTIQLLMNVYKLEQGWAGFLLFVSWTLCLVATFFIAARRVYRLSNIYILADDSHWIIQHTISECINHKLFAVDSSFQKHFCDVAEKEIGYLKEIQKYASTISEQRKTEEYYQERFLNNNLMVVVQYWKCKKFIMNQSEWFREETKFKRWHYASAIEASLSLRTGTPLQKDKRKNLGWFEDELFSINETCIEDMLIHHAYDNVIAYLSLLDAIRRDAIESDELSCYVKHLNNIRDCIVDNLICSNEESEKRNIASMVEKIVITYLNITHDADEIYSKYDVNQEIHDILRSVDLKVSFEKNEMLRNRSNDAFYKNIIIERIVEGKRITPDWLIVQETSAEEFRKIDSMMGAIKESMDQAFGLGVLCKDKFMMPEACVVLSKFFQFENKVTRLINTINNLDEQLLRNKRDESIKWDKTNTNKLVDTINVWKEQVPTLLTKCACYFAADNMECDDHNPDFLGECFYRICDDALDSICNNNINQFCIDFNNLSEIFVLYIEYIRTDYSKNKDTIGSEYAVYLMSTPIVEWAQIGGLAIAWGEFFGKSEWMNEVISISKKLLVDNNIKKNIANEILDYVNYRYNYFDRFGQKSMLELAWKNSVEDAIKRSVLYPTQNSLYGNKLDTKSIILNAFCPDFDESGFASDPLEIFMILCVNPLLTTGKSFCTRTSWEKKLDEIN